MTLFFLCFLTAIAWCVVCSFFEWTVHRYVMHRPVGPFVYPFRAHAVVHHQTFSSDQSYHLINTKDKETIPMAWWNGPVLIVLGSLPSLPLAYLLDCWQITATAATVTGVYYCVYEYIHWCMHLPKTRRLERSWLFRRLNGHHLLHHRYMHKNFNVVLPLADLCTGTFISRAKHQFAQPQNPAVPNVQPRDAEALAGAMASSSITSA